MRSRYRFFSRWQNLLGLILVTGFLIIALLAPILSPNDPADPGPMKVVGKYHDLTPRAPSQVAPLGTLSNQISIYHALVWGSRSAIFFGLTVTSIAAVIGVLIGSISAYFGGFTNQFLMWVTNSFMTFPIIAAIVLIQQLITITIDNFGVRFDRWGGMYIVTPVGNFEPLENLPSMLTFLQNLNPLLIAFILFSWVPYARIMHTSVLRIKQSDYIMAARATGVKTKRIIFRHLIPNAITPVIVLVAKDIGGFVVLQSTFAFIGFGQGSPWASILVLGRDWIYAPQGIFTYWWVFLPATLMLVLFGVGWNLLGDSLNAALNPRENH